MPTDDNFLSKVAGSLGYPEDVTSDEVVRWDGEQLYVVQVVHQGGVKTGERKVDVTADIAATLKWIIDHA